MQCTEHRKYQRIDRDGSRGNIFLKAAINTSKTQSWTEGLLWVNWGLAGKYNIDLISHNQGSEFIGTAL